MFNPRIKEYIAVNSIVYMRCYRIDYNNISGYTLFSLLFKCRNKSCVCCIEDKEDYCSLGFLPHNVYMKSIKL